MNCGRRVSRDGIERPPQSPVNAWFVRPAFYASGPPAVETRRNMAAGVCSCGKFPVAPGRRIVVVPQFLTRRRERTLSGRRSPRLQKPHA